MVITSLSECLAFSMMRRAGPMACGLRMGRRKAAITIVLYGSKYIIMKAGMEMKKIIEQISREEIITLFYEYMDEEFVTGFIHSVSETELVLACVDRFGENNGFLLLEMEGISRIDFGSKYEQKVKILYNRKNQQHSLVNFREDGKSLKNSMLQWARKNDKTVEIGFENWNSEVCGYIEDENLHKIEMIDKYECWPNQGSSCFSVKKAKYIWVDERRARDAGMVYRWRAKNNYEV